MTDTPVQSSPANEQQRGFLARLWYGFWGWIGSYLKRFRNRATDNGSFLGYTRVGVVFICLIYLGLFLFALIMAFNNAEGAASFFGYLRDLVTIALNLTGLLIAIGVGVILIQAARFVNLLRSEVKPITHDAQEAAQNVKNTSEFVQKQAVEPIIQSQAFLAGLLKFLREIVSITRLLRQRDESDETPSDETTETARE